MGAGGSIRAGEYGVFLEFTFLVVHRARAVHILGFTMVLKSVFKPELKMLQ